MIVDAHHHIWNPAARRHAWLTSLLRLRRLNDADWDQVFRSTAIGTYRLKPPMR